MLEAFDVLLFDLDGTLYKGMQPIDGAPEVVMEAARRGSVIRYVTNNASKSAVSVAEHLTTLGLPASVEEVSTSSQAAADLLSEVASQDASVLVVGSSALASEVDKAGFVPVRRYSEEVAVVVQGHSPETGWSQLAEASFAIRGGAVWVACNDDATLLTERGLAPGNGAMVAALQAATGVDPLIAGKPHRPLLEAALASAGKGTPLMVGDKLETDIAGAVDVGISSLLVLTGVSAPREVLFAPPELRPNHVAGDLRALREPVDRSLITAQPQWTVRSDGPLTLAAGPSAGIDDVDAVAALRALCAAHWSTGAGPIEVCPADSVAADALRRLELL